ncbi:hypothetical protein [Streptomyces sp. NPDC050263]|uniref:hypothetical protein n=1 Tax=Streptomyces sp. NPDC050263 TaxID=3155037 RepID=UPI003449E47B
MSPGVVTDTPSAVAEATANPPYLFGLGPAQGCKSDEKVQSGAIATAAIILAIGTLRAALHSN